MSSWTHRTWGKKHDIINQHRRRNAMTERIVPRPQPVEPMEQPDLFAVPSVEEELPQHYVTPESTIRKPECPIATEAMQLLADRAAVGMTEYGITLGDNQSKDAFGWIDDTVEEMLDSVNYLLKLKRELVIK